jgi:Uma2 family endonuclease
MKTVCGRYEERHAIMQGLLPMLPSGALRLAGARSILKAGWWSVGMAVDQDAVARWMVQGADGLELDLDVLQGLWTEAQYLKISDQTNHLIEFTDGVIEVLPMPTSEHQRIVAFLYRTLYALLQTSGAIVLFAPLRVQIRPGKFRVPDLVVLLDEADSRNQDAFWLGADLVVEIVSPDQPQRDLENKPLDYTEAAIPEYWIVNPLDRTISVLTLTGEDYAVHGVFQDDDQATSALLPGFVVSVRSVFGA